MYNTLLYVLYAQLGVDTIALFHLVKRRLLLRPTVQGKRAPIVARRSASDGIKPTLGSYAPGPS